MKTFLRLTETLLRLMGAASLFLAGVALFRGRYDQATVSTLMAIYLSLEARSSP